MKVPVFVYPLTTAALCWLGLMTTAIPQTPVRAAAQDAPLPAARVSLPQLGNTAHDTWSPAQERALGRIIWRDLRSQPDVLTDTLIDAYLHDLTARLAAQLPLPEGIKLRTFAVADAQLNAFAMPSGFMGVHTGLLLSVAQEGELAAVMAHEIGHISQRHFARSVANKKNDAWIALAGFAAAMIAARNNGAQSGQVIEGALLGSQALQANRQLSFSRDMEREADAVGFALMRDAQLDAADMVRMLRRLGAASSFAEAGSSASYAKSHPGTTERMASIEGRLRIAATPATSVQATSLSFLLAQARVRALLAQSGDAIEDANNYFQIQLDKAAPQSNTVSASHTVLAAQYGLLQLAIQGKRWSQALILWAALAPHAEMHPWIAALGLELSLLNGSNSSAALAQMTQQTAFNKSSTPVAAVVHYLQRALAQDKPLPISTLNDAQTLLTQWLTQHPHSDSAWQALASVHQQKATLKNSMSNDAKIEQTAQLAYAAHAQAEQTAAMGVWASSIASLTQALRLGEVSIPIAVQNRWRDRLMALRGFVNEEQGVLDKLK